MKEVFFGKLLLLFTWLVAGAAAHAGVPLLIGSAPKGGQAGTDVQITLRGERLKDIEGLIFYERGLSLKSIEKAEDGQVSATVSIAPETPQGIHMYRVRTATGVSRIGMFSVGVFPQVDEVEPNDDVNAPQRIELNRTVEGALDREGVDYFVVAAKQGQWLSVETEGIRLAPPEGTVADPFVAILGPDKSEIASNDDNPLNRSDAIVSVQVPADGDYTILIRDASYEGAEFARYRAHIGDFRRPLTAYPAGLRAGEKTLVRFFDGDGAFFEQEVEVPAKSQGETEFRFFPKGTDTPAPSPITFRLLDGPNLLESGPNNAIAEVTGGASPVPCALNGILESIGDVDLIKIHLVKDKEYQFTAMGPGIGSPVDPVLSIHKADGAQLKDNDDISGGDLTASFSFAAPEEGDYFLRVTDKLGNGGPAYVYRVEVTNPPRRFTFSSPNFGTNDGHSRQYIAVPQGGRYATLVNVRRERVDGDAQFQVEGLPKGMKLVKPELANGRGAFPLLFEAAPDAPLGGTAPRFFVETKGENPYRGGYAQVFDFCRVGNGIYYERTTDQIAAAVTNKAPFSIAIEKPAAPLLREGEIFLKVKVNREGEFKGAVRVLMMWVPDGVSGLNEIRIEPDQTEGIFALQANGAAPVGVHDLTVMGEVDSGYGAVYNASPYQQLEIAEPVMSGKAEMTAAEQNTSSSVIVKLDQLRPFEGKAKATLLGVPNGVEAAEVTFDKNAKELSIPLKLAADAQTGKHETLFVNVSVPIDGGEALQKIAAGTTLRIDKPRPPPADAPPVAQEAPKPEEGARPLSRLEQLRQGK